MRKRTAFLLAGLFVLAVSLLLSLKAGVFPAAFLAVTGTLLVFFASFERRDVLPERLVLIALLSALAAIGRILFASLPSVQPSSFIIILTGLVLGPETGFMTGAVTALTSNMILGQGPWTPWQMFAWGIMGLLSGLLAKPLGRNRPLLVFYGFVWGFFYGWFMDLLVIWGGFFGDTGESFAAVLLASFSMDLAHGLSNAVLLLFLSRKFIATFGRISAKYGLQ